MQFNLATEIYVFGAMAFLLAMVCATCWTEYCDSNQRDAYLLGAVGLVGIAGALTAFCI